MTVREPIFISSLITALAAEAFVRVFHPQNLGSIVNIYEKDPILKYKYMPKKTATQRTREFDISIRTNSNGFRDREYDLRENGSFLRIMVIGHSMSVGHGVNQEQTYSELLEKKINQAYNGTNKTNFQVINTSVGGYHTYQYLKSIEIWKDTIKPDIVIVGFYVGNDFGGFDVDKERVIEDGYLLGWEKLGDTTWANQVGMPLGKIIRTHLAPIRRYMARK